MRPLELTVSSLRSYRTSTTITFPEEWQLAAVVGLTGAGKSSLLEAIVYALFGSGTVRGASQPINLITDDAREMRVVFRFAVGPEQFEIARTYRRTGNVPPVLRTATRTLSGAADVDAAVARLLGLRQDAFCSTVLLPQGRFATLLQAAAGEQKETLDAFFRLGDVTGTSERLAAAAARLSSARQQVEAARAQLPLDPAADVRQAQRRVREAEARRDAADALVKVVAFHEQRATDAAARGDTARRHGEELRKASGALGEIGARAARLDVLAIEIASAESALAARTDTAAAEVRAASEAVTVLDAPGVEVAAAHVAMLLTRLAEANAAGDQVSSAAAEAAKARIELERIRTEHVESVGQRDKASEAYERARALKDETSTRLAHLRDLADQFQRRAGEVEAVERRRAAAAKDLEHARTAEADVRAHLADAVAKVAAGESAAAIARRALEDAEATAAAAASRAERVEGVRRDVAARRSERDRLGGALAVCRQGLSESRATAEEAGRAESEAEARWRRARAAAQVSHREDAAAAAAAGCEPGHPCPVCARELPDGFVPPAPSTGTLAAEVAEKEAEDELSSCRGATARADADLAVRVKGEAATAQQLGDAELALAEGERVLASEGGADWEGVTAAAESARVRLDSARLADQRASNGLMEARAGREAIARNIEPLAAATERAAAALTAASGDREDAARAADGSRAALAGAGGAAALEQTQNDIAAVTDILAAAKQELETAEKAAGAAEKRRGAAEPRAAALAAAADGAAARDRQAQEAVRTAATAIPAGARRGAGDDPAAIAEAASCWVDDRRRLIVEAQRRRGDADTTFDQVRRDADELRARRAETLDGPLAEAARAGTRLAATADVSSPTATPTAAALAAWAVAASREVERGARARQDEAAAADADADQARTAARAACADAGVEPDGVGRWHADAQGAVGAATEALRAAREVAARARALGAVLDASAERARLLGLARDLCQGRESFANHVLVARRQGLIAEAAAVLTELSNGRLTFAEDVAATFSVLDTATGTTRDPRLLSGGEQFQASLALALALVEIAARAGSRIECLFLDEGFAALDPASLDIALDALEAAARRGRRIVAVTHVDAVTARADQVLGVAGSESGSSAAWRTEPVISSVRGS